MSRFGPLPMLNLIIAMRELELPLDAIKLKYFTPAVKAHLRAGYAASMIELVDEARKLEGKS